MRKRAAFSIMMLTCAIGAAGVAPAVADVAVTTTADVSAVDGQCSLREAVAAAVAQP
jgi:CSLREA domain-containing protein